MRRFRLQRSLLSVSRWMGACWVGAWLLGWPTAGVAQELPPGARLNVQYEAGFRPRLAIRSFEVSGDRAEVARQVREIMRRDLDYSNRFELVETPPSLDAGPVDYAPWVDLGVDMLITGYMEPRGDGTLFRITFHDVGYGTVKEIQAFTIPAPTDGEFRMSVHALSDQVVQWATGLPGHAASRIAFVRRTFEPETRYELMVVDADGENLRTIVSSTEQVIRSPAWHPNGTHIAYVLQDIDLASSQIVERDLTTGAVRVLVDREANLAGPAYSPDGSRLAFAQSRDPTLFELYDMDAVRRCCVRQLTRVPANMADMLPSYSPDGRQIAFMSNRLGRSHIRILNADGSGNPQSLTTYIPGQSIDYVAPDWSPLDSRIAFFVQGTTGYQIMLGDASRPGGTIDQITLEGRSEDPTWAPDGRHLAFSGVRGNRRGLFVIDTSTKRIRDLLVGNLEMPAWSRTLKTASELAAGGS